MVIKNNDLTLKKLLSANWKQGFDETKSLCSNATKQMKIHVNVDNPSSHTQQHLEIGFIYVTGLHK